MPIDSLVDLVRTQSRRKPVRYAAVSAISVCVNIVTLLIATAALGVQGSSSEPLRLAAIMANVISVSVGAAPSYLLNRYWVWGKRGRNSLWAEVVPFWGMAILGLLLSTLFVAIMAGWSTSPFAILGANMSAFGLLWIAKYMLLDALVFKIAPDDVEAALVADAEAEAAASDASDPDGLRRVV